MGISITHLVVILVIVMLIWGPSRLGGLGKSLGEAIRGFKKGLNEDDSIDVTQSMNKGGQNDQIRQPGTENNYTQNQGQGQGQGQNQKNGSGNNQNG